MNVVIIGAGMGGLTTGIALKKFGHQVRIFEQTENSSSRRCYFVVVKWCEMSELSRIN